MGYGITENIFKPSGAVRAEFEHTHYQALILYTHDIANENGLVSIEDFQTVFKNLHEATNDRFAFFFAARPPTDYGSWQHLRSAFKEDQSQRDLSHAELQKLNLNLARCFELDLTDLPAVVLSPSLWEGRFLLVTRLRSAKEIAQVISYTNQLADALPPSTTDVERFDYLKAALEKVHDVGTRNRAKPVGPRIGNILTLQDYKRKPEWQLTLPNFQRVLARLKNDKADAAAVEPYRALLDNILVDWLLAGQEEESEAHPAADRNQSLLSLASSKINTETLDDTSRITLETAIAIWDNLADWYSGDFTPACVGLWKTVEREFCLSVIQAARRNSDIKMDQYYARHDPNFGDLKTEIPQWGGGKNLRLNEKLSSDPTRHTFPTLGKHHLILHWASASKFISIKPKLLQECATALVEINKIRNQGSHTEIVNEKDAITIRARAFDLLEVFTNIKHNEDFPPNSEMLPERSFPYPAPELIVGSLTNKPRSKMRRPRRDQDTATSKAKNKADSDIALVVHSLAKQVSLKSPKDTDTIRQHLELEHRLLKVAAYIQTACSEGLISPASKDQWNELIESAIAEADEN